MKVGLVLANSFEQENLDTMPKILKCFESSGVVRVEEGYVVAFRRLLLWERQ